MVLDEIVEKEMLNSSKEEILKAIAILNIRYREIEQQEDKEEEKSYRNTWEEEEEEDDYEEE